MAAIGADRAGDRLHLFMRWLRAIWLGLQAVVAVTLLAGLVTVPVWFLRDTFSRDIQAVPVVVALTGGQPAPDSRPAAAPGATPALPSPVEAVAAIEEGVAPRSRDAGAVDRSPRPRPRPARAPGAGRDGDDWTALPGAASADRRS